MHYRANIEKVVWRIVDGEAVLVHADTSAYYGLNATATCAWDALVSTAVTREDLSRRLSACYGRDADTLRSDVDAFVATLAAELLIVGAPAPIGDATDDSLTRDGRRSQNGYEPPALSRFGELEKLVLSGE
jgi:Coenzyme PQQ synthesis protein D (PqqD)